MATLETPPPQEELKEFGIRDFIKAFKRLVWITLYGFDHKKK